MARQKKNALDFSMILFLRILQDHPDGTPQQTIAQLHDQYLIDNNIGTRYASPIGNSNGRITRTVNALRSVGLLTPVRELTLFPPRVQGFWAQSGMDQNNWQTWKQSIPFDNEGWLDFSSATSIKRQ